MEALILSCGTGGGHNAAARALVETMEARGHRALFLDPFSLVEGRLADRVSGAYVHLVQKSPNAFGIVYRLGGAYERLPVSSPVYWANGKMASRVEAYLQAHPVDVIVYTHLFPGMILAHLRKRGVRLPPAVYVDTDYTCVPFTIETDSDYYVVPSPDLCQAFVDKGISAERLLPLGIPVSPSFQSGMTKAAAREALGLSQSRRCLLLSGGSIGAGAMESALATLSPWLEEAPRTEVFVLCGSNRPLYDRLRQTYAGRAQVHILEQTDRMACFMRACDLFLTKPGGLSSTEAAVSGVPMVHLTPIPGCETENSRFFAQRGMALPVDDVRTQLIPAVWQLLDPARQAEMRRCQHTYLPPRAAENICAFLEQL